MQTLVAVCRTVWAYVGGRRKFGALGPQPLVIGVMPDPLETPLPTCYRAKFGRSRSNGVGIIGAKNGSAGALASCDRGVADP